MGDSGELYRSVPVEMVQYYVDNIFPYVDVLLPNQTEAEFLTKTTISSEKDAFAAIDILHGYGINTVILTSAFYGAENTIAILGSCRSEKTRFTMQVPKIDAYFTGTGDLFSALVLGFSMNHDMVSTCHRVVSAVQAVLLKGQERQSPLKFTEIPLVQCRSEITNPVLVDVKLVVTHLD